MLALFWNDGYTSFVGIRTTMHGCLLLPMACMYDHANLHE